MKILFVYILLKKKKKDKTRITLRGCGSKQSLQTRFQRLSKHTHSLSLCVDSHRHHHSRTRETSLSLLSLLFTILKQIYKYNIFGLASAPKNKLKIPTTIHGLQVQAPPNHLYLPFPCNPFWSHLCPLHRPPFIAGSTLRWGPPHSQPIRRRDFNVRRDLRVLTMHHLGSRKHLSNRCVRGPYVHICQIIVQWERAVVGNSRTWYYWRSLPPYSRCSPWCHAHSRYVFLFLFIYLF